MDCWLLGLLNASVFLGCFRGWTNWYNLCDGWVVNYFFWTAAMAQSARMLASHAEGLVIESQTRQTWRVKPGVDSCNVKCSATGESVTGDDYYKRSTVNSNVSIPARTSRMEQKTPPFFKKENFLISNRFRMKCRDEFEFKKPLFFLFWLDQIALHFSSCEQILNEGKVRFNKLMFQGFCLNSFS